MMKKFLLCALCLSLPGMWSCNDDDNGTGKGPGTVAVELTVKMIDSDNNSEQPEMSDFVITIEGVGVNRTIAYGDLGRIDDLENGDYTVSATNRPEGMPPVGFENGYYHGEAQFRVAPGRNTTVELECRLVNSGIFFEFDPDLFESGFENIIPYVNQSSETLKYVYTNKDKTGFFAPGMVTVTVENDGVPFSFNGGLEKSLQLELKTGRIYKVYVASNSVAASGEGNVDIKIEIIDVTDRSLWFVVTDGVPITIEFDRCDAGLYPWPLQEGYDDYRIAMMNDEVTSFRGINPSGAGQALLFVLRSSPESRLLELPEGNIPVAPNLSTVPKYVPAGFKDLFSFYYTYLYDCDADGNLNITLLTEGEVQVSKTGEILSITANMMDEEGGEYILSYEGPLEVQEI